MTDTKELRKLLADVSGRVSICCVNSEGSPVLGIAREPGFHPQHVGLTFEFHPKFRKFATLIVAAVNALPDLLDTQDALAAKLDRAEAALREISVGNYVGASHIARNYFQPSECTCTRRSLSFPHRRGCALYVEADKK